MAKHKYPPWSFDVMYNKNLSPNFHGFLGKSITQAQAAWLHGYNHITGGATDYPDISSLHVLVLLSIECHWNK